jgi:magnesium/cobalt transport protein CorA
MVRGEDAGWAETVTNLVGRTVYAQHLDDLANAAHPSNFDGTSGYEVLLFRTIAPERDNEPCPTSSLGLLLAPNLLVTVHEPGVASVTKVREMMLAGQGRVPLRPAGLMHLLLDAEVDRFLTRREVLAERLEGWREALLDPRNPSDDWQAVLRFGTQLDHLDRHCEEQLDALTAWEAGTSTDVDEFLAVRMSDLRQHVERMARYAQVRRAEVESLVQLHFSAVAHRTHEIMRVLTVVSAIFLPLSLIAGIFGMNFENMPELKLPGAYFVALTGMAALGLGLFALFKKKRWV